MKSTKQLQRFEHKVGHVFQNKDLLKTALIHSSFKPSHASNNQRLEFLGDRVLALSIVNYLMREYPKAPVGELASRLNHLVSRTACSEVARSIDLGKEMVLGDHARFSGTRNRSTVLADAMEAVIAAIYLDGGFEVAERTVLSLWKDYLKFDLEEAKDPKNELQKLMLSQGRSLPSYELLDSSGPPHEPEFTIAVSLPSGEQATSVGKTKKEAERKAASKLLDELENSSD